MNIFPRKGFITSTSQFQLRQKGEITELQQEKNGVFRAVWHLQGSLQAHLLKEEDFHPNHPYFDHPTILYLLGSGWTYGMMISLKVMGQREFL